LKAFFVQARNAMNKKEFSESKSGRLVNTPTGFLAFVPNPLPPPIAFDMG
jgi:hypothetical protein